MKKTLHFIGLMAISLIGVLPCAAQQQEQLAVQYFKNQEYEKAARLFGEIELSFDSLRIREALPAHLKTWTIFEENGSIYFIAKPDKTDSLFIYREGLYDFALDKVYAFPSSYTDTMGDEMNSPHFQIVPVHKDTMIIFTWHTVSMLALEEGRVLKHYAFNHGNESIVMVDRAGPLKWNPYRKVLPVMIVRCDNRENRRWEWDSELLGEFSLETGKLTVLPVSYPQVREYTLPEICQCLGSDPLITFGRDRYVVGFPGTPAVFSYDMQTRKRDSLFLRNPLYKSCPPYSFSPQWKKEEFRNLQLDVCDFRYTEMAYDAAKDVYYRFFVRDSLDFNSEGKVNGYQYSENGFTVLDKDLKMLGDVHWNASNGEPASWYPTSKGIYGFAYRRSGNSCGKNSIGNIIRINWTLRQ